jgi:hypothetical protein
MHLTVLRIGTHHVVAPRPAVPDTPVLLADGAVALSGVWDRVQLPYERVALCTPYGLFLSCRSGPGGIPVLTLAEDLSPREAFEEVLWPDGDVSLRTWELTFVAAPPVPGFPMTADGRDGELSTRFRHADVPGRAATQAVRTKAGVPRVADMPRQFAQPVSRPVRERGV